MSTTLATAVHTGPRGRAETEPAPRRPAPEPHERRRHEHPGERTQAHPR